MGENIILKRLLWSGLITGLGALATFVSHRAAVKIWERVFEEEPPE